MVVTEGIKLEWENTKDDIASMVAEAVESFLRNYMNNNILHVHPTQSTSLSILDIQQQLYLKIKDDKQARDADFPLWLALAYKFEGSANHMNIKYLLKSSLKLRLEDIRERINLSQLLMKTKTNEDALNDKRKLKQIDDPKEVYPEQRIIDVIRVEYNQGYGQEYMKEIVVKRADGEYKSFIESDYEYLHKNGIEDMYLMCMDVHDYQLELESYQVKVNLTAPNLIFPSIEEKKLLYIITSASYWLIYMNSKKEKRIMDIDEISKFCDATLKRLLKAVKKIN
ncbi:hypothetical protein Tco_0457813 [Tanacetum coccineum]